mgnify:FL=1
MDASSSVVMNEALSHAIHNMIPELPISSTLDIFVPWDCLPRLPVEGLHYQFLLEKVKALQVRGLTTVTAQAELREFLQT